MLEEDDYNEFVIRWNLFLYKLKECAEEIAFREWNEAYFLVRSSYKDAEAILHILLKAQERISSVIECDHNVRKLFNFWCTFMVISLF